jgi:protocatechuate 3,4-dioxygenase beta subunit
MSKRSLAILAGIVVAAGLAIWLAIGRDEAASKKGTAAAKAQDRPGTAARGSGGAPGGGGDAPGGGVILIDDDPKGALRLEGQVLDAHDEPVGGATVVLSSNPPRTTTTEDDGSFAFDALVGRPYQLVARAPAGVAGPITARLTAESPPVILKLRAASRVTVEVVDDKGAPVDGASIELRGIDTQTATTVKGTATIAPVVPGWYGLAAWAPGFARSYQWMQVAGDSTTARVALRRGARVSGRVVDETGAPIRGARVVFHGASDWSVQIDERRDGQLTDGDGRFTFDAIGAGSVRFDARHPAYAPGSTAIVTLDGIMPLDNVEIVMQEGATVAGTVVDKSGKPVASARVRIGVAGSGFIASVRARSSATTAARSRCAVCRAARSRRSRSPTSARPTRCRSTPARAASAA